MPFVEIIDLTRGEKANKTTHDLYRKKVVRYCTVLTCPRLSPLKTGRADTQEEKGLDFSGLFFFIALTCT